MANKTLTLEAPESTFDGTIDALWFNGGGQDGDKVEHAKTRLRRWLRDEIAAYKLAQFTEQQQAAREQYATGVANQLDAAAETLILTIE